MKKEIAILLSSVALGVIITILFKRRKKQHIPITKSEDYENIHEIHLIRRREHILKQPIKEHVDDSLSDGFYNDDEFSDDTTFMNDNEDPYEGMDYNSKKKNLYLYYDSEIIRGDESNASVPEYQDGSYEGYSSYRPSADADRKYFTPEKHVNINRLCDWNWRFQYCLKKLRSFNLRTTLSERIDTNLNLLHLARDFIHAATTYGKIIISEYYLPIEKKTIKPRDLPGVMGGKKYIVNNILFKFAVDYHGLFGNDYSAAKAAGNELKGLIGYFNCEIPELNVPLMALVDYRGFRLIAMSILPVSPDTIIYGSCDAGRNIHARDEKFNAIMKKAAEKLHIKPHLCRIADSTENLHIDREDIDLKVPVLNENEKIPLLSRSHSTHSVESDLRESNENLSSSNSKRNLQSFGTLEEYLYSPADLEGHKGTDGKYYLLDFSRVLPPETPNPKFKNAHLTRLLRLEFVQQYYKPLCPDAFSGFIRTSEFESIHNDEIREATNHLLNVLIPKFAKELERRMQDAREQNTLHKFPLTETIHAVGINCRHAGLLRKYMHDDEFKQIVLAEIVARNIKNNLRFKLREKMRQLGLPLEEPYRRLVIDYLNLVFGNTKNSDDYWDEWLKKDVLYNFTDPLSEEESQPSFHLKVRKKGTDELDVKYLSRVFERVVKMMGLQFSQSRTYNFTTEKPFNDADLESIGERVKQMNIMAHAQGFFYQVNGLLNRAEDPISAKKCYEIAIKKFEEALDSNPNNKDLLLSISLTLFLLIEEECKDKHQDKFSPDDPLVKKAEEYSLRAISAEPKYDSFSLFRYAQFLERCNKLHAAEDYYLMALESDPDNPGCLHCYGNLLSEMGLEEYAEKFYMRSSLITRSYKYTPGYYY